MTSKRVVLVTGSSRGIGKAIGEKFLCDSVVVFNCKASFDILEKNISHIGADAIGIQADVSEYSGARYLFDEIFSKLGKIDVLINNAGVCQMGLFNELRPDDFEYVMKTNFNSVMNCSHIAVNDMLKRKKGVIVNISSVWGNVGASCEAIYSASKGAVNSFTKALAKELAPSGIRINAIAPGVIDTDMNTSIDSIDELIQEIPMMRMGTVQEIAELAYFLASDGAGYITGQIISADGGFAY